MVWFGLGAAGALVDRDRRGHWLRATARGRRRVPDLDLDQARDRPQAPARRGPAAPDGDADRPLVPVLALDVLVRRRARLRDAAAAGAAVRARRPRWRSRACTWACTTRPTSPPARRSAASWAHWDDDEGRDRRAAQRGQVLAVQRAQPRRGGGGQLPVHHDRAQRGGRAGRRRAPRRGRARRSAPRTSSRTRSSSTTSPGSSRARTRARGWATSSWPTSARPTRCCTSSAATTTTTSSTRTGASRPSADIEIIETELIFADLDQAERRHARVVREARGGDRALKAEEGWLAQVIEALQAGQPARSVPGARTTRRRRCATSRR